MLIENTSEDGTITTLFIDSGVIKSSRTENGQEIRDIYNLHYYCHFQIRGSKNAYTLHLGNAVGNWTDTYVTLTEREAGRVSDALVKELHRGPNS